MGTLFTRNPGLARADHELGFIDITIHNAKGVPKMDSTGLADVYIVISLENKDETIVKSKKTKVKKQTLLPVWEEDFEFIARDTTQNLRFTMFDHDDFGRDDLMGSFILRMADVTREDRSEAYKIRNRDKDEVIGEDGTPCQVAITTKFSPHADKATLALTRSIYETEAGESDLMLAIRAASGSHPKKRVLIQLGSDWCLACKKLFFLFLENKSCRQCLEQFYELVLLDAEREQNFPILKKLGDPQHFGFPTLVVLDAYGRYITTKPTGEMESEPNWTTNTHGYDPQKVFRFLQYWREGGPNNTELGELGKPTELEDMTLYR